MTRGTRGVPLQDYAVNRDVSIYLLTHSPEKFKISDFIEMSTKEFKDAES
jgi:hypothetical protein